MLVVLVAGLSLRGSDSGSSRYVDSDSGLSPPTSPAPDLPLLAPAGAYTWKIAGWGGASYQLTVDEKDSADESMSLAVTAYHLDPEGLYGATSSTLNYGYETSIDGTEVTVDRLVGDRAVLRWRPSEDSSATIYVPSNSDAGIERAVALFRALEPVSQRFWRDRIRELVPDGLILALAPDATSLSVMQRFSYADAVGFQSASVSLWSPAGGWGQLALGSSADISDRTPPEGVAVSIRGTTATVVDFEATPDGRRMRYLTWVEGGFQYALTYGAPISTEEAIDVARRLRPVAGAALDEILFPDSLPADAHELELFAPSAPRDEPGTGG